MTSLSQLASSNQYHARILGRTLKPYLVGHQVILETFECGFAVGAKTPPTFGDLILAVFVCSRTPSQAFRALNSQWLSARLRLWGIPYTFSDPFEKMRMFKKYMDAHTMEPDFWVEEAARGSGGGAVPWGQFLKVKLTSEFGLSPDVAMETRYADALLSYCIVLESKGMIRMFSDFDRDFLEKAKRLEPKLEELARKARNN